MTIFKEQLIGYDVPKHIAFIMDGNGRWARARGKKRTFGHKVGSDTLKSLCRGVYDLGVEYITVYAFSTENWIRPKEEVNFLLNLIKLNLKESYKTAKKDNLKIRVIGDVSVLSDDIVESIEKLEKATAMNTGLKLQIALNYGGRDEILRGIKRVFHRIKNNEVTIEEIDEKMFSNYLDTKDIPDPDLMIRTSGELRLSNFLLWQLAYSEFYFTDKYWPDINVEDVVQAIKVYNQKERRFGGV